MDEIEKQLRGTSEFDDLISSSQMRTLVDRILGSTQSGNDHPELRTIDRYEVVSLVGEGAHAKVYRAYDPKLGRYVALKTAKQTTIANPKAREVFLREAQLAAGVDHRGIMPVYDFGECPKLGCFLVMPSVEGNSLEHVLKCKPLSVERCTALAIAIAEAMSYAHEHGLVHRDLKPANILVDADGKPIVADFGLAQHINVTPSDDGSGLVGTPHYMAPEQVRGENHRVDKRTDVWAFGVTLYELLTRAKPFRGNSMRGLFVAIESASYPPLSEKRADLPDGFERIVQRCLCKRMSDRFESCTQVHNELINLGAERRHGSTTAITTKGLEAFDESDAESFLRLLSGPRDAYGLPRCIRFWKDRIESSGGASSFTVGVLCGPSGSGKSSLVRAGLLPHLSDQISSIFVSATKSRTESDIVAGLRRRFPQIEENASLPNALALVRKQLETNSHRRLLIVIDQFEQWLTGNQLDGATLVDGMRQCDGNISALLLVRDEFWSKTLHFMDAIEVSIGSNMAAKDLMPREHAAKVLGEFGFAHGKLPSADNLVPSQQRFLQAAVDAMAEPDGSVTPVRLAMFAQMMANRQWNSRSLKQLGGAVGIGEQYLESLFGKTATSRSTVEYREPASRVLRELLPPQGTAIRQEQISADRISELAGDARTGERVTAILVDAKLIVPAETNATDNAIYQLPHDYLVVVIRQWLSRYKTSTIRGRAMRLLETRTSLWTARREKKQLPGLPEWAFLSLVTRRHDRTTRQGEMLRVATKRQFTQLGIASILLIVMVIPAGNYAINLRVHRLVNDLDKQTLGNECLVRSQSLLPYRGRWMREFEDYVDTADASPEGKWKRCCALIVAYANEGNFAGERSRRVLDFIRDYPATAWSYTLESISSEALKSIIQRRLHSLVAATEKRFAGYECEVQEYGKVLQHPPDIGVEESKQLTLALMYMQETVTLGKYLSRDDDPRLATKITHGIAAAMTGNALETTRVGDLITEFLTANRYGAVQSLTNAAIMHGRSQTNASLKSNTELVRSIANAYAICPDAGVHWSARSFLLDHHVTLPKVNRPARAKWVSLAPDLNFSIIPSTTGNGSIAIGCTEVSKTVFNKYSKNLTLDIAPGEEDYPALVTLQQAMRFSFELNQHLRNLEQCYDVNQDASFVYPKEDFLQLSGIRVPTKSEWIAGSAANTATHTYIGYNDYELLSHYECNESFADISYRPCGSRLPNQFGLFDMLGNSPEWIQETMFKVDLRKQPRLHTSEYSPNDGLVMCIGGAFRAELMTVRTRAQRSEADLVSSFRIVYSIPSIPIHEPLAKD